MQLAFDSAYLYLWHQTDLEINITPDFLEYEYHDLGGSMVVLAISLLYSHKIYIHFV